MTDLDELQERLLDMHDCRDLGELESHFETTHTVFIELREARAVIDRVKDKCRDTGAYRAAARSIGASSARVLAVEILATLDGGK